MSEITIKDIARECGVGISTVSRAINNHADINPETKRMVMQKIKETGYIPNNSAIIINVIKLLKPVLGFSFNSSTNSA